MKSRKVDLPLNKRSPYGVRWDDDKKQKSFATEPERDKFMAKLTLGLVDDSGSVVIEPFGSVATRYIEGRTAARTRESYSGVLSKHLTGFADRPITEVADGPQAVRAAIKDHPRGKHMLVILRGACDLAVEDGLITGHRLANIHPANSDDTDEAEFIPATRAQLLAMADELGPDGLAVLLMAGTGARVSEVLAVRGADIKIGRDGKLWLTIRRQLDRKGNDVPMKHRRGKEFRQTPVASWLEPYLPDEQGRLFHVLYSTFICRFRLAAARAGLPAGYVPKQLRHLFASVMLNDPDVPISDVARWLGHRDSKTTFAVYGHMMPGGGDRGRRASDDAWERM